MSKRFIDLSTLPKAFRKLDASLKWVYVWLWNNCDASGYWDIDRDYFDFENPGVTWSLAQWVEAFEGHILTDGLGIILTDYIAVNYVNLKADYNPHKPAFRAIEKNKLILNSSLDQACFKLIKEDTKENEEEKENKGGVGEILSGDTELMGFKGRCRVWIQKEHRYVWGKEDEWSIEDLHRKIKQLNQLELGMSNLDIEVGKFQLIITNLDPWVKTTKFSLKYISEHFNEIKDGKSTKAESTSTGYGSGKRDKIDEWYPKSAAGRA